MKNSQNTIGTSDIKNLKLNFDNNLIRKSKKTWEDTQFPGRGRTTSSVQGSTDPKIICRCACAQFIVRGSIYFLEIRQMCRVIPRQFQSKMRLIFRCVLDIILFYGICLSHFWLFKLFKQKVMPYLSDCFPLLFI